MSTVNKQEHHQNTLVISQAELCARLGIQHSSSGIAAISEKRLLLTSNGKIRYELKTPYR